MKEAGVCNIDEAVSLNAHIEAVDEEIRGLTECSTHVLRSPLWALREFARILDEEAKPGEASADRDSMVHIRKSADRLTQLVTGLMDFALVCQHTMSRRALDLSALAEAVAENLRQEHPRHRVTLNIQPGVMAHADPDLMRTALTHLLGNAWKATERTTAGVIEFGRRMGPGPAVFFVRDNGVGFDESLAYKLFCPFQRLHTDDEFKGLGMGLAIVRRIIHLHRGAIWGEGRPGAGAAFLFTLPDGGTVA